MWKFQRSFYWILPLTIAWISLLVLAVFRLIFKVPWGLVVYPCLSFSAITVGLVLLLPSTFGLPTDKRHDTRPFLGLLWTYFLLFMLVSAHYVSMFHIIPIRKAYVAALIAMIVFSTAMLAAVMRRPSYSKESVIQAQRPEDELSGGQ